MHRKYFAGLAELIPYNVVLVELDEGPLMMSNIDAANDEIEVGMRVEVFFESISDEFTIPRFRLAGNDEGSL